MTSISFQHLIILDRNEDDRFDGDDQVLDADTGLPLAADAPQLQKNLSTVGIQGMEGLRSIRSLSILGTMEAIGRSLRDAGQRGDLAKLQEFKRMLDLFTPQLPDSPEHLVSLYCPLDSVLLGLKKWLEGPQKPEEPLSPESWNSIVNSLKEIYPDPAAWNEARWSGQSLEIQVRHCQALKQRLLSFPDFVALSFHSNNNDEIFGGSAEAFETVLKNFESRNQALPEDRRLSLDPEQVKALRHKAAERGRAEAIVKIRQEVALGNTQTVFDLISYLKSWEAQLDLPESSKLSQDQEINWEDEAAGRDFWKKMIRLQQNGANQTIAQNDELLASCEFFVKNFEISHAFPNAEQDLNRVRDRVRREEFEVLKRNLESWASQGLIDPEVFPEIMKALHAQGEQAGVSWDETGFSDKLKKINYPKSIARLQQKAQGLPVRDILPTRYNGESYRGVVEILGVLENMSHDPTLSQFGKISFDAETSEALKTKALARQLRRQLGDLDKGFPAGKGLDFHTLKLGIEDIQALVSHQEYFKIDWQQEWKSSSPEQLQAYYRSALKLAVDSARTGDTINYSLWTDLLHSLLRSRKLPASINLANDYFSEDWKQAPKHLMSMLDWMLTKDFDPYGMFAELSGLKSLKTFPLFPAGAFPDEELKAWKEQRLPIILDLYWKDAETEAGKKKKNTAVARVDQILEICKMFDWKFDDARYTRFLQLMQ